MPFQIIRNDITKVKADAIVNTANPNPVIGSGTDSAIYKAAGEKLLLKERQEIGEIAPGQVAYTDAFHLDAKYIIHTVGPAWVDGNHGERDILHSCYANALSKAAELSCNSIAFPLIATGVYGFPKDEALQIALSEINKFLLSHDVKVILVVFDRKAFELSGKLVGDIEEYIDEHSAKRLREEEYGGDYGYERRMRQARYLESTEMILGMPDESLDTIIKLFTDMLYRYVFIPEHISILEKPHKIRKNRYSEIAIFACLWYYSFRDITDTNQRTIPWRKHQFLNRLITTDPARVLRSNS